MYHTCRYAYHLISSYWRLHPLHVLRILSMSWLPHVVQTVPQWLPASIAQLSIWRSSQIALREIHVVPPLACRRQRALRGNPAPPDLDGGWEHRPPRSWASRDQNEIRKKPTQDTLFAQGQNGKHWKTKTWSDNTQEEHSNPFQFTSHCHSAWNRGRNKPSSCPNSSQDRKKSHNACKYLDIWGDSNRLNTSNRRNRNSRLSENDHQIHKFTRLVPLKTWSEARLGFFAPNPSTAAIYSNAFLTVGVVTCCNTFRKFVSCSVFQSSSPTAGNVSTIDKEERYVLRHTIRIGIFIILCGVFRVESNTVEQQGREISILSFLSLLDLDPILRRSRVALGKNGLAECIHRNLVGLSLSL